MRKTFSLPNLTLFVALALSAVAAYYSIIGLTAIFAGAVMPVIIMGCMLEVAKLTVTVWLRKYWHETGIVLKLYLVPAVIALALITSMGIFGLLSKAHIDQGIGTGDVSAQVALIDEKVKTQRDNIKAARDALAQMDLQVNNVIVKGDTEKSAERSVQIRRQQAKERGSLQKEIETANAAIGKLNEDRAPIASQMRKADAEVGPIKYIAALIYGDNPDANILEKAVRWVIILLVLVFDPLAIAMLLAANQSRDWDAKKIPEVSVIEPVIEPEIIPEPIEIIPEVVPVPKAPVKKPKPKPKKKVKKPVKFSFDNNEVKVEPEIIEPVPEMVEPEAEIIEPVPETTEKPYQESDNGYVTYQGKHMKEEALRAMRPELFLEADTGRKVNTNFGIRFPDAATTGDVFVRVDMLPNQLYKFDGTRWIIVNKNHTTAYLDPDYIQHLIAKVDSGEYAVELLTDKEKQQIEEYLQKNNTPT